jgi:hypothetical protein
MLRDQILSRLGGVESDLRAPDLDAKKFIDTVQDSVVIPAFLATEALPFDPVTFQHVLKASRDFYTAAWTSAHPDFEGRTVFLTCELYPDPLLSEDVSVQQIIHHGQAYAAELFPTALVNAYGRLAGAASGYVDAYALRALVCLDLKLQPQVFAKCLGHLSTPGTLADIAIYTELPFAFHPSGEEYLEVNGHRIGRIKVSPKIGGA